MSTDLTDLVSVLGIQLNATASKESELSVVSDPLTINEELTATFGATEGLVNQIVYGQYTLAKVGTGDSKNFDLTDLENAFGVTVNFSAVKVVLIINRSDAETNPVLEIGNGAQPFKAWHKVATETDLLGQGDISLHTELDTGWSTSGAKDLLITNTDTENEAVFDIVLIGVSA